MVGYKQVMGVVRVIWCLLEPPLVTRVMMSRRKLIVREPENWLSLRQKHRNLRMERRRRYTKHRTKPREWR